MIRNKTVQNLPQKNVTILCSELCDVTPSGDEEQEIDKKCLSAFYHLIKVPSKWICFKLFFVLLSLF